MAFLRGAHCVPWNEWLLCAELQAVRACGAVSLTCPHRQDESLDLRPFPSLWGIQPSPAILSPGLVQSRGDVQRAWGAPGDSVTASGCPCRRGVSRASGNEEGRMAPGRGCALGPLCPPLHCPDLLCCNKLSHSTSLFHI